jgi:imidazoleglycerol-phosphate dehydratase
MPARYHTTERTTGETAISAAWDLDQPGETTITTGIGFFDHMLTALARHSGTAIRVQCRGDLHVDGHHTTEDVGICLGTCLREALGDRCGTERFGHQEVPLDEALVAASVDCSGRACLVYDLSIPAPMIGTWDCELVCEFFQALVANARITLHLHQRCGENSHHIVEAAFKATARALRQAIAVTGDEVPSTKGMLA